MCRFVLPGVRPRSPSEEGILSVGGWVGCPPVGLGVKGAGLKVAQGAAPAHDATVTMSPLWNCPTRWRHALGGWCRHFASPRGQTSVSDPKSGEGEGVFHCLQERNQSRPTFSPRTMPPSPPEARGPSTEHIPGSGCRTKTNPPGKTRVKQKRTPLQLGASSLPGHRRYNNRSSRPSPTHCKTNFCCTQTL